MRSVPRASCRGSASWRVRGAQRHTRLAEVAHHVGIVQGDRLFTWHVTHHAAVKSTNTALPLPVSSATFSGDHSCQAISPARATCDTWAAPGGPGHATATPAAASRIATAARHGPSACSQRPYIHAAIAIRISPARSARMASLPGLRAQHHVSQATVA